MIASETSSAPLTITLFGPMQVLVDGHPLPRLRSRKGLWLLALLALRHNRPVEREWLAATFWPDMDQAQGFANLRPILSELRSGLGTQKERLQSPDRHTLRLDLTDACVDVLAFDAAIATGRPSDLERAVALYRGPLLEGCTEEWVFQERNAREHQCLQALEELGHAALMVGEYGKAIGCYQRMVGIDPWWEAARRGWMEALARSGDTNAALQVYREFVELLRSDPMAVPDEQTTALYQRLRTEVRRLGGSPAEFIQAAAPPAPKVVGYLPHPLTDLVGREDERLEVASRLRKSRLVTLTGLGGIGKTRLAIEVASEVVPEYADGVWMVALESLTEGSLVVRQIATVLGVRDESKRPLLEILIHHLRARRALLVLDNCEHLLLASAEAIGSILQECAQIRILATSREPLGITGETAWAVPALATPIPEHLPSARTTLLRVLMGFESVQLFVERAQAVQKTFALTEENAAAIAQVCARLQGMPLAIELAAARVKTLTVEQIAARLDDYLNLLTDGSRTAVSRQQTLRSTLDWSYALLSDAERLLLERLTVFAEGWNLEAAEQVCSDSTLERRQILDLLTSLTDKSLVVFVERESHGRYHLPEMVRQYGAEKRRARGQTDQVRVRHRNFYLALAEEAERNLQGANQRTWLGYLATEHANMRAALDGCREEPDGVQTGLRLAGALYRFWEIHGHYSEGRAYLLEAGARDGADGRTLERARVLNGAGVLAYYQGDYDSARTQQEEALAIFRELGEVQGVAWSLNDLGDVVGAQGDIGAARKLYEESLATFRTLDNRQGIASLLHHLGRVVREQGDYGAARKLYEESLALFRALGNQQSIAWSLHHLGHVAGAQGDRMLAWSLQEEALAIFRELGNTQGVAWTLNDLGNMAGAQGDYGSARTLYEESLTIFRALGNRLGAGALLRQLGAIVRQQGDYGMARTLYEESLTLFQALGNRQGVGFALSGLGRVAFEQGDYSVARTLYAEGIRILNDAGDKRGVAESLEGLAAVMLAQAEAVQAVCLWGMADLLRTAIGAPLPDNAQESYARQWERVRRMLPEHVFAEAWDSGRAVPWEQAVASLLPPGFIEPLEEKAR